MDDEIHCLWPMVSQEVLESLRLSCEHFRDEVGGAAGSLKGCSRANSRGVEKLAQAVGNKLTENAEISEKREQVLVDLYQAVRKVTTELRQSRGETLQARKEIVLFNQELQGCKYEHGREVRRSVGPVIRKYTASTKQEDTNGAAKLPSKPYLGATRVGSKGESSNDSPPGLSLG